MREWIRVALEQEGLEVITPADGHQVITPGRETQPDPLLMGSDRRPRVLSTSSYLLSHLLQVPPEEQARALASAKALGREALYIPARAASRLILKTIMQPRNPALPKLKA